MKTNVLLTAAACCALSLPTALSANAQTCSEYNDDFLAVTEAPCKTHYYVDKSDGWFLQLGAGVAAPMLEGHNAQGQHQAHYTVNYNAGFGKWFSPYMGWRLAFNGGPLHYENNGMSKFNYVGANLEFMWDMFNSIGGVNSHRVFSVIPFVGLGGTYAWDFRPDGTAVRQNGDLRGNSWTLPVSGGIQLRFRLCKYVDFFAEGRASFYGDNFNNISTGRPIDINFTVNGGLTFNFGGRDYQTYNPCDYLGYINTLNGQINDLRGALVTTAAALAEAEAQLPCPAVVNVETTVVEQPAAPLMATVSFPINSAYISQREMLNVYNIAQWMNNNPDQNVTIDGYADAQTGSAVYNKDLSTRRAQAVLNALVNNYGISADRLSINASGSDSQPYDVNSWNRVVIFNAK